VEGIDAVVAVTAADEFLARWDVAADGEHYPSNGCGHERAGKD
jgi:hypothetical protein